MSSFLVSERLISDRTSQGCSFSGALNSRNVVDYLMSVGLWPEEERIKSIDTLLGKNFNLRVRGGDRDLLVKQAPCELDGRLSDDLLQAVWFHQMLEMAETEELRSRVIPPLHFDQARATLVFPFLHDVQSLSELYNDWLSDEVRAEPLPVETASEVGQTFAVLHRETFKNEKVKAFWMTRAYGGESEELLAPDFSVGLRRLTPESFCLISTDALKFFRFYKRYPEMEAAILALNSAFVSCCAVHDDPRFANLLLRVNGELLLIDWEKWRWGDPAYDLGQMLASYVAMWLESLPAIAQLDLGTVLNMATVPLAAITPSTQALLRGYLACFPQILNHQPNFIVRVTQFIGLALVRQVQRKISQKQPIGNIEMAMAQVAKSLLCQPESSIPTVFGCGVEELNVCSQEAVCL